MSVSLCASNNDGERQTEESTWRSRRYVFIFHEPLLLNNCEILYGLTSSDSLSNCCLPNRTKSANATGLGNIMDAMKKAQEFTSVAKDLQEQLRNTEIEASVRDGQVTVTMTAQQVPLKVEVSDELVAQGSEEVW